MPSLSAAKVANAAYSASYRPVALFVGGTSGIGEGTARAFARATNGNAHILICGRNKANAERIIATFPKTDQSTYEFVPCDAMLMKNVSAAAAEIKSKVNTINYVVLSQGMFSFKGFDPTSEGIDSKLALHFYGRWKFVDELMSCLEKAAADGQEVRVMSVLAPGTGAPLDTEDLGLKETFTLFKAARQAPTYNDLMVAEYSKRHPSMSFIHIIPGFVNTPISNGLHWSLRLPAKLFTPFATSIDDCGEWMASALTAPAYKQGAHYLSAKAEPLPKGNVYVSDADCAKLVEHYNEVVGPF